MDELILLKKKVLELEEANLFLKETEKKLRATNQKLNVSIKQLQISEEQLKAKHETLIRTQRIANVGSWEWDVASDTVIWSDELFRIFRLNPKQGGVSYADHPKIYTPESMERLDMEVKHALESGEPYEMDSEIIRGDGTKALCSMRGLVQKDEKGKVIKLFGYLQDITERKRLEDQLIASEKQFRQLFENMEQGFALHEMIYDKNGNPIDYRFILINNAFNKLTGINAFNYIGKTVKQVLPAIEQIWIDNYGKVAKTGIPMQFEHYSQEFDKYYNVAAYSPQQNYFATIFSDTTQEKLQSKHLLEAKEKAEESQIKFKAAFYTNPDAININKMDGEYVEVNEGFTRLMGYTAEDVIGKRSIEIDIWNNLEDREKLIEGLKEFGIVDNLESTFKTKTGKLIPALMSAKLITLKDEPHILSVTKAIADRKKFEQELIWSKEKAEEGEAKVKLLNNLTSQMLMMQDMKSIYKFIAENLQKSYPNTIVLVVSIDELIKQSRLEVVSGLDSTLLIKAIAIAGVNPVGKIYKLNPIHNSYFKTGSLVEFEGGLAEFSASEFPLFVASALEKLLGLHKIYTIGVNKADELLAAIHLFTFNDQEIIDGSFIEVFVKQAGLVLEKKINEKVLKQAKEKAEESERLKSAFLANMSHEIRTPMNGILGFSQLLKDSTLSSKERSEYVSIIESSGSRLLSTVNDLIDFSKIEADQMNVSISKVKVDEIVNQLYTFFNVEVHKKGLKLVVNRPFSISSLTLFTDQEKLYSILTNLIKNAIKYTKNGKIEFGYEKRDKILHFFVKDTGDGISEQKLNIIFNRFIRGDENEKVFTEGAGLGLSIAKAYVEMLGGKIWVESEEGAGSQFYFTLPLDSSPNKLIK